MSSTVAAGAGSTLASGSSAEPTAGASVGASGEQRGVDRRKKKKQIDYTFNRCSWFLIGFKWPTGFPCAISGSQVAVTHEEIMCQREGQG